VTCRAGCCDLRAKVLRLAAQGVWQETKPTAMQTLQCAKEQTATAQSKRLAWIGSACITKPGRFLPHKWR
jgi:hypothetical protein